MLKLKDISTTDKCVANILSAFQPMHLPYSYRILWNREREKATTDYINMQILILRFLFPFFKVQVHIMDVICSTFFQVLSPVCCKTPIIWYTLREYQSTQSPHILVKDEFP